MNAIELEIRCSADIKRSMKTETALLIFDPHQDAEWIQRILAKEQSSISHLVLGGDYFDAKSDRVGTLNEMCDLLLNLRQEFGNRLTLLWGNHDIQYLEALPAMRLHRNPKNLRYKVSGAYTNSQAKKIAKRLPEDFIQSGKLFAEINGHLISHAGIAPAFWPKAADIETALHQLEDECNTALLNLSHHDFALLQAGSSRGGEQPIGGLTWLDFDEEFEDTLPLPQIFGHTSNTSDSLKDRARQHGRSYCLDGAQTIYGLLSESGELTIRSI
jgi:hypothetical protein